MPFIARILIPDWEIPVRAYLHSSGIEVYGFAQPKNTQDEQAYLAADYLGRSVLGDFAPPNNGRLFEPAKYLLVALFGSADDKMAEVFGYGNFDTWPGNPTKYRWTFKNGFHMTEAYEDGCEDTDIVLGKEAEHRRLPQITDLKTFMSNPPEIGSVLQGRDYRASLSGSGRLMDLNRI